MSQDRYFQKCEELRLAWNQHKDVIKFAEESREEDVMKFESNLIIFITKEI